VEKSMLRFSKIPEKCGLFNGTIKIGAQLWVGALLKKKTKISRESALLGKIHCWRTL
jgi:hypothetical protein